MNLNITDTDDIYSRYKKIKLVEALARAEFEKLLKKAPKMMGRLAVPKNGTRYAQKYGLNGEALTQFRSQWWLCHEGE